MRIAINSTTLLSPLTGVGQYTSQLVRCLQNFPELDMNLFYAGTWSKNLRTKPVLGMASFKSVFKKLVPAPYAINRFIQQRRFEKGIKLLKPDVYHEPNFLAFRFNGPSIITVHDLAWIRYPETLPSDRLCAMNRYFVPAMDRAALILTDSEFIRRELITVFGLAESRIRAVHLGVDEIFYPRHAAETLAVMNRYGLKHGQFVLSVGTLEPRKNLQLALDAWSLLPGDIRRHFPLVLAGMKGWRSEALEKKIHALGDEIIQLGYVSSDDLPVVVSGAKAMVYPSIYEGFGLPPLEAMASGVPVIVSNAASLPEVVGKAGIFVDPNNPDALAESLKQVLTDPILWQALSNEGLVQKTQFSWGNCARQTLAAYKDACLK